MARPFKVLTQHVTVLTPGLLALLLGAHTVGAETAAQGRDVTIIDAEDRTIYEHYRGGVLHQIKVVPDFGRPYYLVPEDETRAYADLRQAGRLIPRWIVHEFDRGENRGDRDTR